MNATRGFSYFPIQNVLKASVFSTVRNGPPRCNVASLASPHPPSCGGSFRWSLWARFVELCPLPSPWEYATVRTHNGLCIRPAGTGGPLNS